MNIQVLRSEVEIIAPFKDLYRVEANCQIVHDSFDQRGLADCYLFLVDERPAGYGGVANQYGKGRVIEFYVVPHARPRTLAILDEFVAVSHATHIEAQTNITQLFTLLQHRTDDIVTEKILFEDAAVTDLKCPKGIFRHEPEGEGAIEVDGAAVATGGFLTHYNPPYGDIYMEVNESSRRQGFGSYLVQELKRICYEAGKKPAARCDVDNLASKKTLQKAGLAQCGRLVVGKIVDVANADYLG